MNAFSELAIMGGFDNEAIMEAALRYAEQRGWAIFPAPLGAKKSNKAAKFSNGRNWGATRDAAEIRRDFERWPDAGVGIPTGPDNNIFVVEADTPEGHDVDGIASLRKLETEHGPLPETLMAESPSGSLHYYFNWPAGATIPNSASRLGPGIDIRGDGGMVIAPPTVRPRVGEYCWINADAPIADAPAWLIQLAKKTDERTRHKSSPLAEKHERVTLGAPPDWMLDLGEADAGKGVSLDPAELPPPVSIDEIKAALAVVPATITHLQWMSIGCGLLKELGDAKGLEVFDAWCATNSELYQGRDQVEEQWKSFVAKSGYDYSIASLLWIANEADPEWRDRFYKRCNELQRAKADQDRMARGLAFINNNSPAPPAVGSVADGFRFLGGNPADPGRWEKQQ
jgi:hypothetical protein